MLDMLDNLRRSRGSSSSDTDENGMIQQKEDKASPSKYIGPANLGHIAQVVSRNDKCGQTHSNENEPMIGKLDFLEFLFLNLILKRS